MTPELEANLFQRYPDFFARHSWPAGESAMARGCATNDGWFSLIDAVGDAITNHATAAERPVPEALQLKEKFGGLRIYLTDGDEFAHAVTMMAEAVSFWFCEVTGRPGHLVNRGGYLQTLCPEMAARHGLTIRVSVPRPSSRSAKYRSVLKGPVHVPRGWLRIVDCMLLSFIRLTTADPVIIDRIAMEGDSLLVASGDLGDTAAGVISVCQAIALRTDKKTGTLYVPTA